MHISTALQNALLAHIDQTFGQEMELLLAEIFMQFAPQQYWDMQQIPRPAGARLRNRLTITPQPNPPPTVGPVSSTTPLTSTPDDPTSYDAQVLRAVNVPPSQDMDTDPTGNGTATLPLRDDAPQQPTQTVPPTPGPRTRFPRCPPGDICPHHGCTYPHHNNPGRLTRHWRAMHPQEPMPGGTLDQAFYNRQTIRVAQQQCPRVGCSFEHQRSSNRLNTHLESEHANQILPQNHNLPNNMVPCFHCNTVIDHRATARHSRICTANQGRSRRPTSRSTGCAPPHH